MGRGSDLLLSEVERMIDSTVLKRLWHRVIIIESEVDDDPNNRWLDIFHLRLMITVTRLDYLFYEPVSAWP
jgi:hypothetical protein